MQSPFEYFVRYILLNYSHRCKYLPTLQFNLRRINVSLGLHIECIATNYEDVHSRKVISHTLIDRLIWKIKEVRRFYLLHNIFCIDGNTESRSPINFLSHYRGDWINTIYTIVWREMKSETPSLCPRWHSHKMSHNNKTGNLKASVLHKYSKKWEVV